MVILLGAELDAQMEHQTVRDTTSGSPKPMGQRGVQMADAAVLREPERKGVLEGQAALGLEHS
jgi:hypothetical protein